MMHSISGTQSPALNLPPYACPPLQELIADGLYKSLARSCFPGRHHPARVLSLPHLALRTSGTRQPGRSVPQVSLALLAKDLGATPARSGSVASMSRLSASIAKRGSRLVPTISRRSSATTTTAGDGSGGEATVSVDAMEAEVSAEAVQEHV